MSKQRVRLVFVSINEEGRRIGESHHNAKYPDTLVQMVQYLYDSEMYGYKTLAKHLGINVSTVRSWCCGASRCQTAIRTKRVRE